MDKWTCIQYLFCTFHFWKIYKSLLWVTLALRVRLLDLPAAGKWTGSDVAATSGVALGLMVWENEGFFGAYKVMFESSLHGLDSSLKMLVFVQWSLFFLVSVMCKGGRYIRPKTGWPNKKCFFDQMLILLVIWFSIYLVLWIWSMVPARFKVNF